MALPSPAAEKAMPSSGEAPTENDSDVFSEAANSQLPVYVTWHGNNASRTSRKFVMPHSNVFRRLVRKSGKANVIRTNIPYLWTAYIRDIGNTLVNSRWRWTILCFASSYVFSWLLFAWFYMLIAQDNNDMSESRSSETPCLVGIYSFAGYFLFSLETQHTTGYGSRYITSNCPEGTFLISLQMIMGVAICGGMASIVYTKMVRPRTSYSKALFSANAVIYQRDGILCLIFRVRDEDYRHGVGTMISAYLVQSRAQDPYLKSLTLEPPGFLLWPLEVVHQITHASPFWNLSAKDVISKRFELIVTLQGTSATTGQCSKTRTSYLSSEILWGRRFKPCVKFDSERLVYYVDNSEFNATEEVLTPLCSAHRLYEVVQEISSAIYTPVMIKSPTTPRFWRLPNEDEDSLENYSGIESVRDESPVSPVVSYSNSTLRKLSTIREFSSAENLKVREGGEGERRPVDIASGEIFGSNLSSSVHLSKWSDEVDKYLENMEEQISKAEKGQIYGSGVLDVEELVASLQNYLEEYEKANKEELTMKQICKINF